ncbi:MAG: UDP-N-acetylmuramoyl-tripeptide--D-alanyl-D-alanine ligase, partial [Clostridia bacterium]|nr:UDP-N-acetylmuramoyl-tripeptide--D-alanyl-D-alanine ligase [Clostridia bacterium]
HMVLNALAAIAVGIELGVPLENMQRGLAAFSPLSGRMTVEKLPRFTLLNDVYNANPTSMAASLQVLSRAKGRKVCILGDMLELGDQAPALHHRVLQEAKDLGVDMIVGVGALFAPIAKEAGCRGYLQQQELLCALPALLSDEDTILVKGSRGMHLEDTVNLIRSL